VIVAEGGLAGGFSLYVKNNRVYYEVNTANDHSDQLIASSTLRPGLSHILLAVTPDQRDSDAAQQQIGRGLTLPSECVSLSGLVLRD
jgi:hypothetical protein